jgi:O-acetylhomoserine (thiol)-lyase
MTQGRPAQSSRFNPRTRPVVPPIHQSVTYFLDDDAYKDIQAGGLDEIWYGRFRNPTVDVAAEEIRRLEGAESAFMTASGMGAIATTLLSLVRAGDRIVAARQVYGDTRDLLVRDLPAWGFDVVQVDALDLDAWRAAVAGGPTRVLYVETLANPQLDLADLPALAEVAHSVGALLVVDNTFATPYSVQPLELGADVVVHSATKFLGGAGTTLGGVVVESGRFHWANEHFPLFDQPVPSYGGLNWHGNFGEYAFLTRLRAEQLRDIGPALSPHSAWLLAQGVETLPFRLQAHVDNARIVAEWLDADPRIEFVNWAGLAAHPHHERANKYLPKGPGSVFSFGVAGGRAVGQKFIESVDLASHLANIGDAKTLVIHPASTTHAQLTEQQLGEAGVLPGLVRISVGIEDPDDIIYDLDQALNAATEGK